MVNLVAMPVSRETMEKYQNRHVRQLEHAAKQYDAMEMRTKNDNMRRQWLERQTNAAYRNEYDRIRGELSRYRIPFGSKSKLEKRAEEIRRLFSSGNV